jgi:hypothetical protein
MVCQFCYDRPIVKATGQDGKTVEVSCPVCGTRAIPGSGTADNDAEPHRKSGDQKSNNKNQEQGLEL